MTPPKTKRFDGDLRYPSLSALAELPAKVPLPRLCSIELSTQAKAWQFNTRASVNTPEARAFQNLETRGDGVLKAIIARAVHDRVHRFGLTNEVMAVRQPRTSRPLTCAANRQGAQLQLLPLAARRRVRHRAQSDSAPSPGRLRPRPSRSDCGLSGGRFRGADRRARRGAHPERQHPRRVGRRADRLPAPLLGAHLRADRTCLQCASLYAARG